MVLTSRMDPKNDKMWTSMDLLQAVSQCHNGDEDTQAAYNIIAGMFVSSLEGRALTGKDTTNFLDLWINAPKGTSLVFIPPDEEDSEGRLQILEEMIKEGNYPDRLIETVFNTSKAIFVPDKPTDVDGIKRWAWLEIDPESYETIAVFDTGEHGSFASYLITKQAQDIGQNASKYALGAFIVLMFPFGQYAVLL